MQHAPIERFLEDPSAADEDPIIAPLLREQLEPMMGGCRDGGAGGPERALMGAMLQDAVLCLMGEAAPATERARLAADARHWVVSRSRAWIFAFESVCDALGIDPDYARRYLLKLADERCPVDGSVPGKDDAARRSGRTLRGLRHGGNRPRRAIHFMSTRRRRQLVAQG